MTTQNRSRLTTRWVGIAQAPIAAAALFLATVLALVACGAAFVAPEVSPELLRIGQKRWPDATQSSLARGRATFMASCGKGGFCHRLPDPQRRSEAEWPGIVERMAKKARLDSPQSNEVLRFITAARELQAPATSRR